MTLRWRCCDGSVTGTARAARQAGRRCTVTQEPGLSDDAIDQETAVALPERDALSLVDGGIRLVPIATIAPEPTINPDATAAPAEPQPPVGAE